jgi:hypothetical protein
MKTVYKVTNENLYSVFVYDPRFKIQYSYNSAYPKVGYITAFTTFSSALSWAKDMEANYCKINLRVFEAEADVVSKITKLIWLVGNTDKDAILKFWRSKNRPRDFFEVGRSTQPKGAVLCRSLRLVKELDR